MRQRWYYESLFKDTNLGIKVKSCLYEGCSKFQNIQVFDTYGFGRILVLDGITQTTEKDEFIYHEMLTHVPMISHPQPKNVLIIGGGDGGILREALKYPVRQVSLVEIDKKVIELSKKYLSKICKNSFQDKRANIIIGDGARFLKSYKDYFDVIIIDSSDPIGPSKILFKTLFYRDVFKAMTKDGIVVRQAGSSFFQSDVLKLSLRRIKKIFPIVEVYGINVPTYIGGIFDIVLASKKIDPHSVDFSKVVLKYKYFCRNTKYYNPKIHFCSFTLPNYIMN